jgi:1,2-diacylglycerol 3-alpha-glucosyltransferase
VTMQHSLCCRCAVVLNDVPAHQVYKGDNGWLLGGSMTLSAVLREVGTADLSAMQRNSYLLACEMLDYRKLSRRILQ